MLKSKWEYRLDISATKSLLRNGLEYARDDILITPGFSITQDGFCGCGDSECQRVGRHPKEDSGLLLGTANSNEIRDHWGKYPNDSLLTPTGTGHLIAIGFNSWVNFRDAKKRMEYGGEPTKSFMREGCPPILLFRTNLEIPSRDRSADLGPGVKVYGRGDYLPLPPSIYDYGRKYITDYQGPIAWLSSELHICFKE